MRHLYSSLPSLTIGKFVHIILALFVFSYIAFDILDLDLSDFPLKNPSRARIVAVTEIPRGTELASLLGCGLQRLETFAVHLSISKESIRLQHKHLLRIFTLEGDRVQVHRITHPVFPKEDSPLPA